MSEFKSSSKEEFICISYYDTEDLPIDSHCIKYRNIKYDIQEVLERTDDIDYVISDSKTTRNLLKENERLNNIINELKKYIEDTKQDGYKLVWINEYKNYFEAGIEEILGSDKE